ncbi:MAG: excalibur calcium-binding domain-containing protein [Chloroflexi bacterium]|nr:excalibur calcium-binding domain-containing protein [Chloroflexota bacterium]
MQPTSELTGVVKGASSGRVGIGGASSGRVGTGGADAPWGDRGDAGIPRDGIEHGAAGSRHSRRAFLGWAGRGLLVAVGLSVVGNAVLLTEAEAASKKKNKDQSSDKKKKKKNKKKNGSGGTSTSTFNAASYVTPGVDKYNCTDFTNQADTQAVLRADPTDPNVLDRNRDGIACSGVDAAQDGVPGGFMMPPYDVKIVNR